MFISYSTHETTLHAWMNGAMEVLGVCRRSAGGIQTPITSAPPPAASFHCMLPHTH